MATSPQDSSVLFPLTLILGGVSSGKSIYAERLAEANGPGIYIATAEALDEELAERVHRHKARRGANWTTVEEPLELVAALNAHSAKDCCIVVDCLTLWLNNLMEAGRDLDFETHALLACLPRLDGPVILIDSELGLGGIANNELARRFADQVGSLNQALGSIADRVIMMVAGFPVVLKDTGGLSRWEDKEGR